MNVSGAWIEQSQLLLQWLTAGGMKLQRGDISKSPYVSFQTVQDHLSAPQGSSPCQSTAATWSRASSPPARATAWRPSCPYPTVASRSCRARAPLLEPSPGATAAAAAARCLSAWSCRWGKETAWAWWGPEAASPPPRPERSCPPSAPSSCTRRRLTDSCERRGRLQKTEKEKFITDFAATQPFEDPHLESH